MSTNNVENQEQPLSKNAQKRLLKQQQKEAEQQARPVVNQEEEISPEKYYENRVNQIKKLKETRDPFPFPHKFELTHEIPEVLKQFSDKVQQDGEFLSEELKVPGRVFSMRKQGKNLIFIDIKSDNQKLQVICVSSNFENEHKFNEVNEVIKRGDIIGVVGNFGKSKTGEFSLQAKEIILLAPCLHVLPDAKKGQTEVLTCQETRYRNRYLDLMVNTKAREVFITRSQIISIIRRELGKLGFLEVETPILSLIAGGATAKPFNTFHNDLNTQMVLRIAPELYLKRLVVGGLHKVYELGKQFRNEQVDLTHNPEFTSIELYQAYADYNDMMNFTEELLCTIAMEIKGKLQFTIKTKDGEKLINFQRPWRWISVVEELEKILETKFPEDFETVEAHKFLDDLCNKLKIPCSAPRTSARLLDKLISEYLEVQCDNPTFLIDHPQIMCPLAKYHRSKKGMTERFEMFINQKEFVNSYTELNDPFIQKHEFEKQIQKKLEGDDEACDLDMDFVKCLEHGLPPTGGWGLGVDWFVMLLTDSINIQEVLLFPVMKAKENQ